MKHKAPLILLLGLTLVLIFIVGLRYGQHVEKTNKQNAYNFSLTPQIQPTSTTEKISYSVFTHKPCKVEFVVPDNLKKIKESSTSATFEAKSGEKLTFSCELTATGTAKLNPYTGRKVFFMLSKELQALLDNSLTFLK